MIDVQQIERIAIPPVAGGAGLDRILDAHLQNLLIDLREFVPYDVAAAWLGHDDRPSLRVVLPSDALLPPLDSARHLIFQATAEAARIADLHTHVSNDTGLRCWLGVPLVVGERRRGWIELLSSQPNRFSDHDLQRAGVIVRYAAEHLALVEREVRRRNQHDAQARLIDGLQRALLAPSVESSLSELLRHVVEGSHAQAATLVVPTEIGYTLGLYHAQPATSQVGQPDEHDLVVVAARWPVQAAAGADRMSPTVLVAASGAVLPLIHNDETVGWISLRYTTAQPMAVADPTLLDRVTELLAAMIGWLREQAQREQQAQQSVRMLVQQAQQWRSGATTDLIAGLAHELQNPVGAITGLAGLLGRDPSLSEEVQADVRAMAAEATRIATIVQRLGHFADPPSTAKAPLPFNDLVADVLAVMGGVAEERGIALHSALPAESPMVPGNRAQLGQALLDLLSNAFEAVTASDAPTVRVAVAVDGGWLVVQVSDNGYGIPEDLRERIWTPGFTTRTAGGTRRGLGIGLPLALDIVRNHRGTLAVSSQIWQGSCFTLRLPLI